MNLYIITGLLMLTWKTSSLEISPNESEIVLKLNSTFTLSCSANAKIAWKHDENFVSSSLEYSDGLFTNTLTLHNVSGVDTGLYSCLYNESTSQGNAGDEKSVYIFVPDPSMWFLPIKEHGEFLFVPLNSKNTIPCRVTNPNATVTLHDKMEDIEIYYPYDNKTGFTGYFEDKNYYCKASLGGEEVSSNSFHVYSVQVSAISMDVTPQQSTVRIGNNITIVCAVTDNEILNFTWNYPGRKTGRLVNIQHLSNNPVSSILTIPDANAEDSGTYTCAVEEGYSGNFETKDVNITVVEMGYVKMHMEDTLQPINLHQSTSIVVSIESYPEPTIEWLKGDHLLPENNNSLVNIQLEKTDENTYVATLSLVRVKEQDGGFYTLKAYNEDDSAEKSFYLQINVPVEIKEMIDSHPSGGGQMVTCVGKGMPKPVITWYICTDIKRCSSKGWSQWEPLHNTTTQIKYDMNISYSQPVELGTYYAKSILLVRGIEDSLSLRCLGENNLGMSHHRDVTLVPHHWPFKVVFISSIVGLVVLAVIFLIILIVLWKKKPRYEIRWKVIESVSTDGHEYIYVDPLQLPYDSSWEISRDKLVLGKF